jgi:hypothetical protein
MCGVFPVPPVLKFPTEMIGISNEVDLRMLRLYRLFLSPVMRLYRNENGKRSSRRNLIKLFLSLIYDKFNNLIGRPLDRCLKNVSYED